MSDLGRTCTLSSLLVLTAATHLGTYKNQATTLGSLHFSTSYVAGGGSSTTGKAVAPSTPTNGLSDPRVMDGPNGEISGTNISTQMVTV